MNSANSGHIDYVERFRCPEPALQDTRVRANGCNDP